MLNVYIAAKYSRRDDLRTIAKSLREFGYTIVSNWLNEAEYPLNVQLKDVTEQDKREIAERDWAEIQSADVVLFVAEDQNNQPPRGGRHVEFGIALALNKPIIVIGERENIFHHLPQVMVVSDWLEAMKKVNCLAK